jgi:hypothetical protein
VGAAQKRQSQSLFNTPDALKRSFVSERYHARRTPAAYVKSVLGMSRFGKRRAADLP